MAHVIVVGSGIAGLIVALEASREHRVTLVTKTELAESNTRYAQGGIAAAMFADDSVESHIADTMTAGAGLNDRAAVEVLCAEGPDRIRDLIGLGVAFDRVGDDLARGLEAAHSRARVLHAGGDATGAAIETALVAAVRRSPIEVREFTFLADLIVGLGRVRGIEVVDREGQTRVIDADTVVLASGGAGQLYRHSTNPRVATGDGAAAALRAGAVLSDVEFYQFHPTSLAVPGNYLVSEAVRGEGAVLRDARGRRFMLDVHDLAELAPRDVVARGIARQMAAQGGEPVMLDATALGATFLAERFPSIDLASRSLGLDWSEHPIPVTPAAHYWMGGVRADAWGRTSLPGLFAVGEVSCTGVHGANRLASNSLLESLVFAWRSAEKLADDWPDALADDAAPDLGGSSAAPPEPGERGIPVARHQVQDLAWAAIGLFRDADGLESAAATLASWTAAGDGVTDLETRNLLDLSRVMVASALARRESRGAHFRSDFPETDPAFARHLSWVGDPSRKRDSHAREAIPAC